MRMTKFQLAGSDGIAYGETVETGFTSEDYDSVAYLHQLRLGDINVGTVMASYLSRGSRVRVDGVLGVEPAEVSTCLHRACSALGVTLPHFVCRVQDIPEDSLLHMQNYADRCKVFYSYYTANDKRNHVVLVSPTAKTTSVTFACFGDAGLASEVRTVGVTSLVNFFNSKNSHASVHFYSGEQGDVFGADNVPLPPSGYEPVRPQYRGQPSTRREPSVAAPDSAYGTANVVGGVARPRKRVVASKSKFDPTGMVQKSYTASGDVQFNNLTEMFLDTISRDYAQQILEELFAAWAIDMSDPNAVKFAEDLVCAFIISTTASNKADYSREFEVPQKKSSVVVNFDVLSRILAEGHNITRRQFARGISDDMHKYVKEAENVHLLSLLASRAGCDPQMAHLAFDGSTHCTGLTSHQLAFTKLLESRNLFEDESLLADGASRQLMQGMSSGPRSIISR